MRRSEYRRYTKPGGSPIPPVILLISDCASALPCSIACFTPLRTSFLKKLDVFGIDDFLRDLNRHDITRAIRDHRDFAAAGLHLDGFLLQLSLRLGHLLLHLLSLLHQLVDDS